MILQLMKNQKTDILAANAKMIEKTLDSFGIQTRVAEVADNKDTIHYSLEIAMGTKLDDVIALNKDLAIALAAPEGKVEILAPEPGRSLVGVIVKKAETSLNDSAQKYKIIRIKEKEFVSFSVIARLRNFIAQVLYMVGYILLVVSGKVKSEYSTPPGSSDLDPLYDEAVELVRQDGRASASLLQRRLDIGYARAARIIDQMETWQIVGPAHGSKPRKVLVK